MSIFFKCFTFIELYDYLRVSFLHSLMVTGFLNEQSALDKMYIDSYLMLLHKYNIYDNNVNKSTIRNCISMCCFI